MLSQQSGQSEQSGNCSLSSIRFVAIEATETEARLPNNERSNNNTRIYISGAVVRDLSIGDRVEFRNLPTDHSFVINTSDNGDCALQLATISTANGLTQNNFSGSTRSFTAIAAGDFSFSIYKALENSQPFFEESVIILRGGN